MHDDHTDSITTAQSSHATRLVVDVCCAGFEAVLEPRINDKTTVARVPDLAEESHHAPTPRKSTSGDSSAGRLPEQEEFSTKPLPGRWVGPVVGSTKRSWG